MGRRRPWRARARPPPHAVPERVNEPPFFPRLSLLPALPSTSPSSQEAASSTGSAPSGSRVRHFWQLCGWALPPARFGLLLTSEPRAAGRREEDPTAPGQTRRLRPVARPPARPLLQPACCRAPGPPAAGRRKNASRGSPSLRATGRPAGRQTHAPPFPPLVGGGCPQIGVRGASPPYRRAGDITCGIRCAGRPAPAPSIKSLDSPEVRNGREKRAADTRNRYFCHMRTKRTAEALKCSDARTEKLPARNRSITSAPVLDPSLQGKVTFHGWVISSARRF